MAENEIQKHLESDWKNVIAELHGSTEKEFLAGLPPGRFAVYAMLQDVRLQMNEIRASGLPQKYANRFITSAWTVKDLLSHLASWAFELRREVETIASHESFDYIIPWALTIMGPNQWNQTEVEKRRSQDAEQAIHEFDSEIGRIQDLILILSTDILYTPTDFPEAPAGVSSTRWRGSLAQMAISMTGHYSYHLQHLYQWMHTPGLES